MLQVALEKIQQGYDEYVAKASGLLAQMEQFDGRFADLMPGCVVEVEAVAPLCHAAALRLPGRQDLVEALGVRGLPHVVEQAGELALERIEAGEALRVDGDEEEAVTAAWPTAAQAARDQDPCDAVDEEAGRDSIRRGRDHPRGE